MDWPAFMRPYKIGEPLFPSATRRAALAALPQGEGRDVDKSGHGHVRIYRGVYNLPEAQRAIKERARGPAFVAVSAGVVVAGVDRYALWVEPAFRGMNLAVELYVSMFLEMGPERWVNNKYTARDKPMPFSKGGVASRRKAYLALVERGYIEKAEGCGETDP